MKIAMFTDAYFPRINGVTVSVQSFAEGLCKLGHEVCVVCLEYTEEQQKSSFFDEKTNFLAFFLQQLVQYPYFITHFGGGYTTCCAYAKR